MAHLANPPGFGTNSFFEDTWGKANGIANPRFVVADTAAWRPTVNTGATRTVTVDLGSAWACGVYDETNAVEQIAFAANSSGSDRIDALVARFDWSTDSVSFQVITGTTSPPVINTSTTMNAAQVNRIPGVRYDALIALVRVPSGSTTFPSSGIVTDLRTWGGSASPLGTYATSTADLARIDLPNGAWIAAGDPSADPTVYRKKGTSIVQASFTGSGGGSGLAVDPYGTIDGIGATNQTVGHDSFSVVSLTRAVEVNGMTFSTGRLTATRAGLYLVTGKVAFTHHISGRRMTDIWKNGSAANGSVGMISIAPVSSPAMRTPVQTQLVRLAVGDYLQLAGYQSSGTTLEFVRSECFLSALYVRP